jgi:tetratricopeptide (TPR) repeat protein
LVALLLLLQAPAASSNPCRDSELTAMLRAREHIARGDVGSARDVLGAEADVCAHRRLALLALRGWAEARALASGGGALELQRPVQSTLNEIRSLAGEPSLVLDVEYADTCIRAAIAAAQDERPEMELLLTHARDLAQRMLSRNRRAVWPRSYNLVAGELWFEVDRYADAVAAYERALRADVSPMALTGLGRALARLERVDEACAAYRRVTDAASELRAEAADYLARCR